MRLDRYNEKTKNKLSNQSFDSNENDELLWELFSCDQ